MEKTVVRIIGSDEYPVWDAFVDSSPQGTVFHTTRWLTLCKNPRQELRIYGCFDNTGLIGGCALYITRYYGLATIARTISMMTPFGGVLLPAFSPTKVREQETQTTNTLQALCDFWKNEHFTQIKLVHAPEFRDIRLFRRNGWADAVYYTYYLNPADVNLSRNARRGVKKATEEGITISSSRDVAAYFALLEHTYGKQNLDAPMGKDHFTSVCNMLFDEGCLNIWMAKDPSGELIAAEAVMNDAKRAYRWSAASDHARRNNGAHFLLMKDCLEYYREKGFREMNAMTGNLPNFGEFTTNFNPTLVPYFCVEKKTRLVTLFRLRPF